MIVLNINFARVSGPGNVAHLIHSHLKKQSKFASINFNFTRDGFSSLVFRNPLFFIRALVDRYFVAKKNVDFTLFKKNRISKWPQLIGLIEKSDTIILHWVSESKFDLLENIQTDKKIIWRLPDMEPFTGGCHYSSGCSNFKEGCSNCPQVHRIFRGMVKRNFRLKAILYQNLSDLTIVAPSKWIYDEAKKSRLLKDHNIIQINNPVKCVTDKQGELIPKKEAKESQNIIVFGFVAAHVLDKRKCIIEHVQLIDTLMKLHHPDYSVIFKLAGRGKITQKFKSALSGSLDSHGFISDRSELRRFYKSLDFFVSSASEDNSPATVLEALCLGIPVISRNRGGQAEAVKLSGLGCSYDSVKELELYIKERLHIDLKKTINLRTDSLLDSSYNPQLVLHKYSKILQ